MNVEGSNRAPSRAQIRQAQMMADGSIDFVVVQDFTALPDTQAGVRITAVVSFQ